MSIKVSSPLYPFLLAAFYPLKFLNDNAKFFNFSDIFFIETGVLLLSLLVFFLFKRLYKSSDRAGLITFFLGISLGGISMTGNTPLVWLATIAIMTIILLRWHPPKILNVFANIFCIYLIGYTAFLITTNVDFKTATSKKKSVVEYQKAPSEFNDLELSKGSSQIPSIFHIVLDGYSGELSLKKHYKYDNSDFISRLESMGFLVLKNTHTPYNQTLPTLSSVFLGRYWKADGSDFSEKNAKDNRRYWGQIATQGPLHSKLKQAGYTLAYTESGYPYLEPPADARHLKPKSGRDFISDFSYHYTLRTILGPWLKKHLASDSIGRHNALLTSAFSHSLYQEVTKPFFLYQHILSPHPPFIFDDEGNTTKYFSAFLTTKDGNHSTGLIKENIEIYKKGYINKLNVTNKLLLEQLDQLFKEPPEDLVIIIQGDHGGGAHLDQNSSVNTCLSDRFSPLFAVFSTDESIRNAFSEYKSSSYNIVNTYRIILSKIFDTRLPLLEDHSWFIPWNNLQGIHPIKLPTKLDCEYLYK